MVEQYGSFQSIQNMASVSNLDSQTLIIKPWDRTVIHAIAKAISDSGL
jgi:ribosome recycling factor